LHAQPLGQGHGARADHQPPDRQPARRRAGGDQPRAGPGQHLHGAPAGSAARPAGGADDRPGRVNWSPKRRRGEKEVIGNGAGSMRENAITKGTTAGRVGPHRSLRVLFVDDETSLREFMRSELPRLGHEVTVCPDGKAALKALEKATFDAAILDLRMPGMTGIEVLEHLKAVSPDTEAIVMTGHAS